MAAAKQAGPRPAASFVVKMGNRRHYADFDLVFAKVHHRSKTS